MTTAEPDRRVVISGMGIVSPLGIGLAETWDAIASARVAVGPIGAFDASALPNQAGGEIRKFDPRSLSTPKHKRALAKSLRLMARDIVLAVVAAEMAIVDGGIAEGGIDPTRFGVDLGAGLISSELDELAPAIEAATDASGVFDFGVYGREGIGQIPPLWLLKYLPNMPATHISILNDCQGPSNSITETEAASNLAIGEALRIIQRGQADVMIAGGADSKIHPLTLIRMSLLGQTSTWSGPPSGSCRPFDRARSGWVPGEGAGILILEERSHAERRGARIYGEILGFGSGCDAYPAGGIDPDGAGTEVAMSSALREARLSISDVGHIHAHGVGSPVGDLAEARAFRRMGSGKALPPVTSIRGAIGNLVAGAGVVDLIVSLIAVNRGLIPATANCENPDPECDLDVVHEGPRPSKNPLFATTNVTCYGQAAALVVRGEGEES